MIKLELSMAARAACQLCAADLSGCAARSRISACTAFCRRTPGPSRQGVNYWPHHYMSRVLLAQVGMVPALSVVPDMGSMLKQARSSTKLQLAALGTQVAETTLEQCGPSGLYNGRVPSTDHAIWDSVPAALGALFAGHAEHACRLPAQCLGCILLRYLLCSTWSRDKKDTAGTAQAYVNTAQVLDL